jgi:hypothetical protein
LALDELAAGPEPQVISVGEDELEAELFEVFAADGFDGALSANGHEGGGFDDSVVGVQAAASRAGVGAGR